MVIRSEEIYKKANSLVKSCGTRDTLKIARELGIHLATSGGSGIGKTNERLAPSCKGAKLLDGKVFKSNVGHQELAAWVEGLGLLESHESEVMYGF